MPTSTRWLRLPFPSHRLLILYLLGLVLFFPWLTQRGHQVWLVRYLMGVTLLAGIDLVTVLGSVVHCRRTLPSIGHVGRTVSADLWVENRRFYPIHLQFYDDLAPSMVADTLPVRLRVAPRSVVRIRYRVRAYRRGRFRLQWAYLWLGGPLGLVWRPLRRPLPGVIRVDPDLREAMQAVFEWRRNPFHAGRRRMRRSGPGTEFMVLRPYALGDDWRTIDWSATARHRRPFVRVYHQEMRQRVWIILDASRVMGSRWRGKTRMDYAAAAAANLAWLALALGDRVRFLAYHHHVIWQTPWFQGLASVQHWLPVFSELEMVPVEPNYRGLYGAILGQLQQRSLVVWFTSIPDPRLARDLLVMLETLAERNQVVLVNLQDPSLTQFLYQTPRSTVDAYAVAVAAQMDLLQRGMDERLVRKNVLTLRPEDPWVVQAVLGTYRDLRLQSM